MRNFSKILLRAVLVIAIILFVNKAVEYTYKGWGDSTTLSKNERDELSGTLDTVYCGSSYVYADIMPMILDEKLGTNSYDLSTASQPLIGTYYQILEEADNNPIENVYVVLSIGSFVGETSEMQYLSPYENLRTLKWKLRYVFAVGDENVTRSALLYATRLEKFWRFDDVEENVENKQDGRVNSNAGLRGARALSGVYEPTKPTTNEEYEGNYWDPEKGTEQVNEDSLTYLNKIIDFCEKEGITLTFLTPPLPQNFMNGCGDWDGFHAFVEEIAEEHGITYYDFALYKDRQEVFTNDLYDDWKHLNSNGAEVFSSLLADVILSDDQDAYFYDSVSEFPYERGY